MGFLKTLHCSRVKIHPRDMKRFILTASRLKTLHCSRVKIHPRDMKRFSVPKSPKLAILALKFLKRFCFKNFKCRKVEYRKVLRIFESINSKILRTL